MAAVDWRSTLAQNKKKGILLNEKIFNETFDEVVNKAFDHDMGFGYVSEGLLKPKARIVLQARNPFLDNYLGQMSSVMSGYHPYSQVYHLDWQETSTETSTLCILRHYLHTPSLNQEELSSIKVATCSLESMDSIQYKVTQEEEVEEERKMSLQAVEEENVAVTVSNGVTTQEKKQSITVSQTDLKEKKPMKKKSTQFLLEQMNQIVRPLATSSNGEVIPAGQLVLTIHKAREIEKKGLVGKADPYVVITFGDQKEKSATVNNNHNPVWQITANFDVTESSPTEVAVEVYDDDIGKDDFLGRAIIDIHELLKEGEYYNKWVPLSKCKSGEILVSAKLVPLKKISRPVGHLSLTLHKAKKIEKKNLIKKADPYVVIKLGKEVQKTKTINNSHNPTWNFGVEFDILETSPRQMSFEVFDDDIGNDATLGNLTIDLNTVKEKLKMDNLWMELENCKSGQLLLSAKFTPSPPVEEDETVVDTEIAVKQEVIEEQIQEKTIRKESVQQSSAVVKKVSRTKIETSFSAPIEVVDPIYQDDEYVVVEKGANNWFMVVSQHKDLPIGVNLVPFKKSGEDSSIFIYPLPSGGFHNIKRVVHSGRGLRKCGYEKKCVMTPGVPYQFWSEIGENIHNLGSLSVDTFGPDKGWVEYKQEYFKPRDYIETTLTLEGQTEPVFSGSISLYDTLNVEAA